MKSGRRNESGFTLAIIVVLGVVASMWLLGTAGLVMPTLNRVTKERTQDQIRSSAESGLDWAVQQINNAPTTSPLLGQSAYSIPSSLMSNSHFTGTISVVQTNQAPTYSYLYDTYSTNWQIVTASVTNGVTTRRVRVILKPVTITVKTAGSTSPPVATAGFGPATPLFARSMFSPGAIGGAGNMTTNSYDSAANPHPSSFDNYGGDVGTNTSISLKGNSTINGNLTITSDVGQPTTTVATGSGNAHVNGAITANGTVSSLPGTTVVQQQTNPPVTLAPVPAAPTTAINKGPVSLSGNSTLTLTSGDYIMSSISVSGNAKIVINATNGPVNIYVQGSGSSSGISLTGNGISNSGIPNDLRIFYGGTGDTKIAGNGSITGVVYAPNSNLKLSGNGTVFGAVVTNSVDQSGNGTFHYDRALGSVSSLMWNPPITVWTPGSTTPPVTTHPYDHFQAVSWYEF